MQRYPRNGASIDRVYLHTNEGPQNPNAAQNLLDNVLSHEDGGYNVVVDDAHTVVAATDDQIVDGEGGDNTNALSICMIGYSASTDWTTPYSVAMIERAAQQAAVWCKAYNVPVGHVPPGAPGQPPTQRGIAEHADDHSPYSQGHTDPGHNFPIDAFVTRVSQILAPPIDWSAVVKLVEWERRVSLHALTQDSDSAHPMRPLDTAILRDLLIARHAHNIVPGNVYGPMTVIAVHVFKNQVGIDPADGTHFGSVAAAAILKP